jgi:hypothetical protein
MFEYHNLRGEHLGELNLIALTTNGADATHNLRTL